MSNLPAIFISYAREDLPAALKIAESLRQAGLEVWLDLDELRGGDAWDSKIKRQIRECSLFLPIISQQTQKRKEGYFRLEWLLAEQRFQLIARGTPFLVPVAVDDVTEGRALVPESFLAVQWTRLPGGNCPAAFPARVATLLAGGGTEPPFRTGVKPSTVATPARKSPPIWPTATAAVVAGILGILLLWKPWVHPVAPTTPTAPAAPVASSDFPKNPDLKRAWDLIQSNKALPGDFALAEDLAKGVMGDRATDPEAVTVMASIQVAYLYRGFDFTPQRTLLAQHFAERAVALDPDNAYAQSALGIYAYRMDQSDRAVEALNKAIAINPDVSLFYRFRDDSLFNDAKVSTVVAITSAEKTAAKFPNDPLTHYELARHYRDVGLIADMETELDKTIALSPIVNAVVWKARVALWVRGDPAEMRRLLDQVPARGRSLERWAIANFMYSIATGKTEDGLNALNSLPEDWCNDYDYTGPKSLLVALLLEQQGKHDLARLAYAEALANVEKHEAAGMTFDFDLQEAKMGSLYGLGRLEEARTVLKALNEGTHRPYYFGFGSSWWFSVIPSNLLLGNKAEALQFIRDAVTQRSEGPGHVVVIVRANEVRRDGYPTNSRHILYEFMKVDPRMAPFRDDPEIKALIDPGVEKKP